MKNDYNPNGTEEYLKIGIIYNRNGYYVSNEGTNKSPNFHVWIPSVTHAICDSAYSDLSIAKCRCDYLFNNKIKAKT